MPGFMPGIQRLDVSSEDVDGRDKPGHDVIEAPPCTTSDGFAKSRRLRPRRWRGAGSSRRRRQLIALDETRRARDHRSSRQAQARRNAASKEIGEAKKKQGRGDARRR